MTPRLLVSVAIATYNGSNYILEQLDSIFSQRYLPDEVILCDDMSSDTTVEKISSFQLKFPDRLRLYRNEKNLGFAHNFEKAISLCKGDIIFLSDQDDFWMPHKLERMLEAFQEHPECGFIFSDAEVVDNTLQSKGYTVYSRFPKPGLRAAEIISGFMHGIKLLGCTSAFRAKYRPYLLPIAPKGWGHDHWIAFVMSSISNLYLIDEPLLKYRRHTNHAGTASAFKRKDVRTFVGQKYKGLSLQEYKGDYERWNNMLQHLLKLDLIETSDFSHETLRESITQVNSRVDYASNRLAMKRRARHLRIPSALGLLQSGAYAKYSRGPRTFIKDLLA